MKKMLKIKLLYMLICIVILLTGVSFVMGQEIVPDNFPKKTTESESSVAKLIFFMSVLILAIIVIFFFLLRNKGNSIWKGAFIGGLYVLIPSLLSIHTLFTRGGLGDPGPFWPFMLLPFLPLGITLIVSGMISWLISQLSSNYYISNVSMIIVNFILWILIGTLIGWLIKKNREKKEYVIIWICSILGLLFGGGTGYLYFSSSSIFGLVFSILLGTLIGTIIGFIIKKLGRRNEK
ncbi:hypothetical protein HYV50_04890 [Candidatus Pacearchaeota archaeon]|nr:hypothetical protein [Candidatus Pacearchaeota archaeon]